MKQHMIYTKWYGCTRECQMKLFCAVQIGSNRNWFTDDSLEKSSYITCKQTMLICCCKKIKNNENKNQHIYRKVYKNNENKFSMILRRFSDRFFLILNNKLSFEYNEFWLTFVIVSH